MRGEYGTPGASLGEKFDAAGEAGRYGELRTGQVLRGFARRAVIVHDVIVPGLSANLDHIVVSGTRGLIIDSKAWRDGFYHRLGVDDSMRRGREALEHDRTESLLRMQTMFSEKTGVAGLRSVVVVWPSQAATAVMIDPSLRDHTVAVHGGNELARLVRRFIGARFGANPHTARRIIAHAYSQTAAA